VSKRRAPATETPLADPTALTMAMVLRETEAVRDEITRREGHLRELISEKFASVSTQFKERDTRQERETRNSELAVTAAFQAQEKQAVAQDKSNGLAITKSENATAETIKTNRDLSISETRSLAKSVDDLKLQVNTIIASGMTVKEQQGAQHAVHTDTRGLVSMIVGIVGGSIGLISFVAWIFESMSKG